MSVTSKSFKQSLMWLTGLKITMQLIRWMSTFLVIRFLTPEDYGLIALVDVVESFVLIICGENLTASVVQKKSIPRSEIQKIYGLVLLISFGLVLLQFAASYFFAFYYDEARLVHLIQVSAAGIVLSALGTIPHSILIREMKFKEIGLIDFCSQLTATLVTLYCAYTGYGVWSLVYGYLVQLAIRSLLSNYFCKFREPPVFTQLNEIREHVTFNVTLMLSSLVWLLYTKVDILVINKLFTIAEAGAYVVALQISVMPLNKIMPIVKQVAFPVFSEIKDDPNLVRHYYLKSLRINAIILVPILFGLGATSFDWVSLVLGERWVGIEPYIFLLAIAMPFRVVLELLNPTLKGLGHVNIILGNMALTAVLMLLAVVLLSNWGLLGISAAYLLVLPLVFAILMYQVRNVLPVTVKMIALALMPSLVAAVFMVLSVFSIAEFMSEADKLTRLLSCVFAGGLVYVSALFLLGRQQIREVLGLFR